MQTRDIDYRNEAANLRGYLAFEEKATERRPGVLVFHEGLGLGDFAMDGRGCWRSLAMWRWPPTCSAIAGRRAIWRRQPNLVANSATNQNRCLPVGRPS